MFKLALNAHWIKQLRLRQPDLAWSCKTDSTEIEYFWISKTVFCCLISWLINFLWKFHVFSETTAESCHRHFCKVCLVTDNCKSQHLIHNNFCGRTVKKSRFAFALWLIKASLCLHGAFELSLEHVKRSECEILHKLCIFIRHSSTLNRSQVKLSVNSLWKKV